MVRCHVRCQETSSSWIPMESLLTSVTWTTVEVWMMERGTGKGC